LLGLKGRFEGLQLKGGKSAGIMDECFLNLYINYEDEDNPDIDIFISGDLNGEIQKDTFLKFQSKV